MPSKVDLSTDHGDDAFRNGRISASNGKVVDLLADEDSLTVNDTMIDITLVRGRGEAEC